MKETSSISSIMNEGSIKKLTLYDDGIDLLYSFKDVLSSFCSLICLRKFCQNFFREKKPEKLKKNMQKVFELFEVFGSKNEAKKLQKLVLFA